MTFNVTPPRQILPVLQKIKDSYLFWHNYHQTMPKTQKYSLGVKIDNLFTEIIEAVVTAGFLKRNEKIPYVHKAIQKLDTLKIFLMILWETKTLNNKKYATLSILLDEIGKMLGGWHGQLLKQNSPEDLGEK